MELSTLFYGFLLLVGGIVTGACFLIWFMPEDQLEDVLIVKGDSDAN